MELFKKIEPLELSFPPGLFSDFQSEESKKALKAIRIIEELLKEEYSKNTLFYKLSLLQDFPDSETLKHTDSFNDDNLNPSIIQYIKALIPDSYFTFLDTLMYEKDIAEIFLKFVITAHESIGKIESSQFIIKAVLENVARKEIKVNVSKPKKQFRAIDTELRTKLNNRYSILGKDFALGKKYFARPITYDILIGPIELNTLKLFQQHDWATEFDGSERLYKLVSFTEPYYFHSKITFLVATLGFQVGKSILGESKLGKAFID